MKFFIGILLIIVGFSCLFAGYLVQRERGEKGVQSGNIILAILCFTAAIVTLFG